MVLRPPSYDSSRHPIEVWQEWYRANIQTINTEITISRNRQPPVGFEPRSLAPYEYTDSLNQRQVWEPYLTGRERQQFDSHLREFIRRNRGEVVRLRPGPSQQR